MTTSIHPIPIGVDCCYPVTSDRGAILIDGGTARHDVRFPRALKKLNIDPTKIKPVLVTHAHRDHFGCVGSIREQTGAVVASHPLAKERMEK